MAISRNCKIFIALFLYSVALLSVRAQNIILNLRNGDRFTGTVLSENTEQIVISTQWSKEIIIPFEEISNRQDLVEAPETLPAPSVVAASQPTANPQVELLMSEGERQEAGFKFSPTEMWHGRIDLGLDLAFGPVQRQLYYGKARIVYAPPELPDEITTFASRFRNTFEYQVTYGKTEGILSDNRMDGLLKPELDIGRRVFTYSLFSGGYDEARKIDFQYELGPGLGYRLVKGPQMQLNTELGFDYQSQLLKGNGTERRFSIRIAQDYKWIVNDRLNFDEKFEYFPNIEDPGNYRFRFESNLRYRLWKAAWLTFSVVDLYDTEVAVGVSENDLQLRSLLGVDF